MSPSDIEATRGDLAVVTSYAAKAAAAGAQSAAARADAAAAPFEAEE